MKRNLHYIHSKVTLTHSSLRNLGTIKLLSFLSLLLVICALPITAYLAQQQSSLSSSAATFGSANVNPDLGSPTNLTLTNLDSTIRANWIPSSDPTTAWHVFSVWDTNNQLVATKIVGKGANAADANGLRTGDTYTIQVQAMNGAGQVSPAIQALGTTDAQLPMKNAAFFETFNDSMAGNLDPNYFDVRTNETVSEPDSLENPPAGEYPQKRLVFNNERHFHTQLIGTSGHGGVVIRPRVPFDFTNRTGTFEFEVDLAAVQKSHGKWFVMHLSQYPTSQDQDLGDGDDGHMPDTIDFSLISENNSAQANGYNLPTIEVNTNGNRREFVGTKAFYTPVNVRVPIVLKVSQNSAEMFINGESAIKATGFTLPYTVGYWNLVHRNYYTSIFFNKYQRPPDMVTQLVHWDVMQYDGQEGSYNPVVKTYIQPGCKGIANYGHNKMYDCAALSGRSTVTLSIPDDLSLAKSALLLFNGSPSGGNMSVNGTVVTPTPSVGAENSSGIYRLNSVVIPVNLLKPGANTVTFNYSNTGFPGLTQVELEVVYNQHRAIGNPLLMAMPMLNVTSQNVQIYHSVNDPAVQTGTVYLYNMGNVNQSVEYKAEIITPDTPWLSVSQTSGNVTPIPLGGQLIPLTFSVDSSQVGNTDDFGKVGVVRVTGGNMPILISIQSINDTKEFPTKPAYIPSFPVITTFNKLAIPDYHGDGNPQPTISVTGAPTLTPTVTTIPTTGITLTPTSTPTPLPSVTPTSSVWVGKYYNNTNWSGTPLTTRTEGSLLNYDWQFGSPAPGVRSDNFSVRWNKKESFIGGTYTFKATVDDTMNIYVDGVRIKRATYNVNQQTFTSCVTPGSHALQVDFNDFTQEAVAKLSYTRTGTGSCATDATPTTAGSLPTSTPAPTSPPSASGIPWLKTTSRTRPDGSTGMMIVTQAGNPITLRGANVLRDEWTGSMTYVRQAVSQIATNWKGNLVTHGFASGPVNSNDTGYLARLDEYVQLAKQNKMYINLTYYYPTENGTQPNFPDQAAENAIAKLAVRYKNESNVIFQLQAEPNQGSRASLTEWRNTYLPRFNSMVTAIRNAASPNKPLIFVPGLNYGRYLGYVVNPSDRVTADGATNIVYSTHVYDPVSEFQSNFLDTYDAGLAVAVTEFGTGGQMNQSEVGQLLSIMKARNLPWTAWVMDSEGCPCLITDRTSFALSSYGTSVRNEMLTTPVLPE